MTAGLSREFAYRDKKLGDTETIRVAAAPDVFYPTSTTVLLLRAARRALSHRPRTVLDLGCGCGVVDGRAGEVAVDRHASICMSRPCGGGPA